MGKIYNYDLSVRVAPGHDYWDCWEIMEPEIEAYDGFRCTFEVRAKRDFTTSEGVSHLLSLWFSHSIRGISVVSKTMEQLLYECL